MALISDKNRFLLPQIYLPISHGHIPELKAESGTVSAQVDQWSKVDTGVRISEFMPS